MVCDICDSDQLPHRTSPLPPRYMKCSLSCCLGEPCPDHSVPVTPDVFSPVALVLAACVALLVPMGKRMMLKITVMTQVSQGNKFCNVALGHLPFSSLLHTSLGNSYVRPCQSPARSSCLAWQVSSGESCVRNLRCGLPSCFFGNAHRLSCCA